MQNVTMTDVFRDRRHVVSVSGYVVLQSGLFSASECVSRCGVVCSLFLPDAAAEVAELVEDSVAAESAPSARKRRERYSQQPRTLQSDK